MARHGKAELVATLSKHLGWEQSIIEDVVEALASKKTQAERAEIIEGYLGDDAKAKEHVSRFFESSKQDKKEAGRSMLSGKEIQRGKRMAGSVTVRHVPGRPSASASKPSRQNSVDKDVCNCLCCGKIYLTRQDTDDIQMFLDSGGQCTFCGALVSLLVEGRSESRPVGRTKKELNTTSSDHLRSLETAEKSQQDAEAFKNRLVEYDRNARQRTTVVDDQNDYFEIDTNAWLDPEERAQLKLQEKAMEEAEEARKRRVTVTVDLLGRQVIMADDQEPTEAALQFREAAQEAAQATAKEIPQGGGSAVRDARSTATRIQPNLTPNKAGRPIFVQIPPETVDERRSRRGIATQAGSANDAGPQSLVGGWGDKQTLSCDAFGPQGIHARSQRGRPPGNALSNSQAKAKTSHRGAVEQMLRGMRSKNAKRPQLKRLQHDDPFEALTMSAMDAF